MGTRAGNITTATGSCAIVFASHTRSSVVGPTATMPRENRDHNEVTVTSNTQRTERVKHNALICRRSRFPPGMIEHISCRDNLKAHIESIEGTAKITSRNK